VTMLPSGWQMVTLNDLQADEPRAITDGPFGSNLTSAHYTAFGARVIRLQNVGDGDFKDIESYVSLSHFGTLRNYEARQGDLVVASLGDDLPRACIVPRLGTPAIVKADCIRARLADNVDPRWVLYMLLAPQTKKWAAEQLHGVGRQRLGLKVIRRIPVPLPPFKEQQRIVTILEDHLSSLNVAREALEAVQLRLTAWTAAARDRAYTTGRDQMVSVESVATVQGGIQKQPKRAPKSNAYPFLRVANVMATGLHLTDVHQCELFEGELERYALQQGDLLVVEGNGSRAQIGRAAAWTGEIQNCVHQNHLIRIRPTEALLPRYLEIIWNASANRRRLMDLSSSSSGLHTLSTAKLKSLLVPVPAVQDQEAVISELGEVEQAQVRLSDLVTRANRQRAALRRSLLGAAFSGRLTMSDPVEEPVDV
jgi:type I restriction enzyme S subunit